MNIYRFDEVRDDINRNGKHDRAVIFCRDVVQSLEITQLKYFNLNDVSKQKYSATPPMGAHLQRRGAFMDDLGGVPQRPARLVLALGRDNLGPRLPGSLGLGSHRSLELLRQSSIFSAGKHRVSLELVTGWGGTHISTLSTLIPQAVVASSRIP